MAVQTLVVADHADQLPRVSAGPWVLLPSSDGSATIGAFDRGVFSAYARARDEAELRTVVTKLLTPQPAARPVSAGQLQRWKEAAQQVTAELTERVAAGESVTVTELPAGLALDHIGHDSGHTLFLLGTPFGQRSAPPTDLRLPRTGYLLKKRLPPQTGLSPVQPWFGQRGGGLLVSLDAPIRAYCEAGYLQAFDVAPQPVT
nr:TNT domain-containing protein [Kineococcus vitellinus]